MNANAPMFPPRDPSDTEIKEHSNRAIHLLKDNGDEHAYVVEVIKMLAEEYEKKCKEIQELNRSWREATSRW